MYTYYKDSIVGIQYASNDDVVTKHVLECGFEISGQLPNYPKGKTKRDFINTQLKQIEVTKKYDLIVSNEKNLEHEAKLDNLIPKEQNKQIDLQFVALDNQTVAGGVYGYIKNGYLYVSLLVVSDDYRGQRIASQLMDLIEKESHDRGYDDMYLDTCEFQALGFYLKRDYKKIATIKQFPKGFDEYTLAKKYR